MYCLRERSVDSFCPAFIRHSLEVLRGYMHTTLGQLFEVSAYTLGGGGIGQVWGETDREEAVATVREAYDAGITLFDMAPAVRQRRG